MAEYLIKVKGDNGKTYNYTVEATCKDKAKEMFCSIFVSHGRPIQNIIDVVRPMSKPTRFWVWYNGKYMAGYKSVRACLNFIKRKKLQDDYDNTLRIVDNNGDMYNVTNGNKLTF
jgi:hypothetical protein